LIRHHNSSPNGTTAIQFHPELDLATMSRAGLLARGSALMALPSRLLIKKIASGYKEP